MLSTIYSTPLWWDPVCDVSWLNTPVKVVKSAIRETWTWNSISTQPYIMYLILGEPIEYLSDAGTTWFDLVLCICSNSIHKTIFNSWFAQICCSLTCIWVYFTSHPLLRNMVNIPITTLYVFCLHSQRLRIIFLLTGINTIPCANISNSNSDWNISLRYTFNMYQIAPKFNRSWSIHRKVSGSVPECPECMNSIMIEGLMRRKWQNPW